MDRNVMELYDLWCRKATEDPDLKEELASLTEEQEQALDLLTPETDTQLQAALTALSGGETTTTTTTTTPTTTTTAPETTATEAETTTTAAEQ